MLKQEGETAYPDYDTQLAAMRKLIAARPAQAWGSTVYDAWLHALQPMFASHGKAFPDFMRSQAWTAKDHQTAFGSYAELKHDSILYAKQSFAEGGDICSTRHGGTGWSRTLSRSPGWQPWPTSCAGASTSGTS